MKKTMKDLIITIKHVYRFRVLNLLVALIMINVITFLVFPGAALFTSLTFIKDRSWFTLFMVLEYNIFDTIGRYLGGIPKLWLNEKALIICTYLRAIFIVTFMLIVYKTPPSWLFGVKADWFKIVNMMLFSFTNGFFST